VEVGEIVAVIDTEASGDVDADGETAEAEEQEQREAAEPGGESSDTPEEPDEKSAKKAADGDGDDSRVDKTVRGDTDDVRITPVARKLLEEAGVTEFGQVVGTGSGGRITKSDARAFVDAETEFDYDDLAEQAEEAATRVPEATKELSEEAREREARRERDKPPAGPDGQTEPEEQRSSLKPPPKHLLDQLKAQQKGGSKPSDVVVGDNDEATAMTGLQRSISQRMVQSRQAAAHCSTVWEADVTRIVQIRSELRREYEQRGVKLTFTPFFLAALADGLRRFPILNSSVDGDDIVYRGDINIGIATPWRDGLVVPVIHKADFLNLFGLARSVNEINRRIRSEEVRPSDVEHGTFTVTNTGVYGSLFSVPTILQPQVAIMSIGRIAKRVKVEQDDTIRIRSTVHLGLTFDHRAVNFERADRFMRYVVHFLENWEAAG
jgi:2-oxoglutarate dehydrogenase E2 component (dihydrolipoamide succinyltransferase)